jgi:uncharacterized protein YlaI
MKVNRLKELESIAEKLGIGQNRDVKCINCHKTIKFNEAVILTNKKKVTYLCEDCYEKLEKGELNKKQIETDDILKEIEKFRKENPPAIQPVPYIPKPIPWKPEPEWYPDKIKWEITPPEKAYYSVCSMDNNKLLKFEAKNAYNTNGSTTK